MNLLEDIYYNQQYSALYADEVQLFTFEYREGNNFFCNQAIKKPIDIISYKKIDSGYYDLETPYGYGGYYTNTDNEVFINNALKAYRKKCLEDNIIAEFIRFHPFNEFALKFGNKLDMCILDRQVVIIDLQISKEERWKDYGSTTRNILRKCADNLEIINTKDIPSFMNMYKETMQRNNATDFYYFDKNYYKNLLSIPEVWLFGVIRGKQGDEAAVRVNKADEWIGLGFFMFGKDIGHYHLSANSTEHLKLNANYYLLDSVFDIAKEKGCKYFMLGGGRTNAPDDPLYLFKRKFSSLTRDFYIAGNVINEEKYSEYNKLWESFHQGENTKYFLKYRL